MYSDWTTTFFSGLSVEFWVTIAPPPGDAEIEFLRSVFQGRELLDVACGAGRYTIPLAEAGYAMTGVDLSDDFLRIAGARCAPLPVGTDSVRPIAWEKRDIRDLPWNARFDGALCFGNSFGYFPRAESRELLRGIARSLKNGAAFVLETGATAESLLPALQRERIIEAGEIVFHSASRYETSESRLDIEYTFTKGGEHETKAATTWVFTAGEVSAMLNDAGLTVENVYASLTRDAFVLGSPRAIFVARKT